MMLVTGTCSPPSWEAMLPQEFSAATTWIFPPDDGPVAPDPELLHPATASATTTSGSPHCFSAVAVRVRMSVRSSKSISVPSNAIESSSHYKSDENSSQMAAHQVPSAEVSSDFHDIAAERLRRHDQRYTSNRRALVAALSAGRPMSLPELLAVSKGLPQSSAYRNLAVL